ncbi:MAG: OFA family MFS transporter [Bacillota bacterium]|nr:OFA family MFS transporter [Bacillota bacterium]
MSSYKKGWSVTAAGTGINLALGVLYAWSIFKADLVANYGLTEFQASLPFMVACGFWAIMMVPAGRWQDRSGPGIVAGTGGALTGLGLILASFSLPTIEGGSSTISSGSFLGILLGFGVLAGTGIGLGYASTTPAAIKWFPSAKKGLITGIVVSGFGLASVYISPLSNYLLETVALKSAFLILGIGFLVVTVSLSLFLKNPPAGYIAGGVTAPISNSTGSLRTNAKVDYKPTEMIKTPQFILLWVMFALTSLAGLMIIGHIASISKTQAPEIASLGFWLVAILAIFNAAGRIGAGVASDKLGRTKTMLLVFLSQAIIMTLFPYFTSTVLLIIGTAAVGFNYGSLAPLFPSATADYFGTKNLGVNYGLVFTAWGVGGVLGGMLGGVVVDLTGTYNVAFQVAAGLLLVASLMSLIVKAPVAVPVADG